MDTGSANGGSDAPDPVREFLEAPENRLHIAPVLAALEAQAEAADRTRSVATDVLDAIRGSDFMRMSATTTIGGVEASMLHIGRELEAVAAGCPSTAWCLWNHLCVFHLFVGSLGPDHADFLSDIVRAGEWVSFPAGAGSSVYGRLNGDHAVLNGKATWGTGARYANHCGVVFAVTGDDGEPLRPMDLRFTIVPTSSEGMKIDPTWDGSGLRASATDDVHYSDVRVPLDRCVAWYGTNRAESLRTVPVIDHRYREDWVGLSDLWLGWMAIGVVRAAIAEAAESVRVRRVLMGGKMIERPAVQINVGKATALTAAAKAAVETACNEVDHRIEHGIVPTEADYLRQMAIVSMAVNQLIEAMDLLQKSQGGTALREGGSFDRRRRDFAAMPLHINVHEDRVTHQLGRFVLGIDLAPF
ncbi:MAG: acyl-CoA dehydrogenase family protein [Actinomycetota bacterium]|jgi:3-hydroxy-9,10-secoandrosta-1,3,5(10)-triene-9,17-dione monooxygenase|nr:acyl-CoA dehydrogenase family protein [Actinomycetota bacterium]